MAKISNTLTNPISGITIIPGTTYWYPTVPYCCHFTQTKVKSFKFDPTKHIDFVLQQPIYATEADAKGQANAIRSIFGFPPI